MFNICKDRVLFELRPAKKKERRRRRRKKTNKIEIFKFGFLDFVKVSRTNRVDLALE